MTHVDHEARMALNMHPTNFAVGCPMDGLLPHDKHVPMNNIGTEKYQYIVTGKLLT